MKRPKLLDLFCGQGGAAMGYYRAGFEVVGVDVKPQPRYPFEFVQADAMTFPLDGFDVIHASPPCQAYCALRGFTKRDHPELIGSVRERLILSGRPFVIENTPGAPLRRPILVCGSWFGLQVRRHRLFESNVDLYGTYCTHKKQGTPICVTGTGGRRVRQRSDDKGGACNFPRSIEEARLAMGIEWMTRAGLSQAVPSAYTEFIGKQLMRVLE